MRKFTIGWSKTYVRSGEVEIEAETEEDAINIVDSEIGNYDGSIQYLAEENTIDVMVTEVVN